jgi:hypothetical protein
VDLRLPITTAKYKVHLPSPAGLGLVRLQFGRHPPPPISSLDLNPLTTPALGTLKPGLRIRHLGILSTNLKSEAPLPIFWYHHHPRRQYYYDKPRPHCHTTVTAHYSLFTFSKAGQLHLRSTSTYLPKHPDTVSLYTASIRDNLFPTITLLCSSFR